MSRRAEKPLHIDRVHGRAIRREIGERLETALKPGWALPPRLRLLLARLTVREAQRLAAERDA